MREIIIIRFFLLRTCLYYEVVMREFIRYIDRERLGCFERGYRENEDFLERKG